MRVTMCSYAVFTRQSQVWTFFVSLASDCVEKEEKTTACLAGRNEEIRFGAVRHLIVF